MKLPIGRGHARSHSGDGGLDVAAWRPFRDGRPGHIVLLGQCTVERDWFHKAKDLGEDSWRGWIDFAKAPHLVLAVPYVIPDAFEKWDELRRLTHTALDRMRLCELLENCAPSRAPAMKRWVVNEVARMAE
jgi:hypothetical protein